MKKVTMKTLKTLKSYANLSQYFTDSQLLRMCNYFLKNDRKSKPNDALDCVDGQMSVNPYQLGDVPYMRLKMIDDLVTTLPADHPWHIDTADPRRISAMADALFVKQQQIGRAVIPMTWLTEQIMTALVRDDTTDDEKVMFMSRIAVSKTIHHVSDTQVMQASYYQLTIELANNLIQRSKMAKISLDESLLTSCFTIGLSNSQTLSDEQQDVVRGILSAPLSLLLGYAGVGKSTLLAAVCRYLDQQAQGYQLCSWSAKAAFNMTQITSQPSSTIASLIWMKKKLTCQYLIIDEISTVPESALADLMKLVPDTTRVIMIGDGGQLPSVKSVSVATTLTAYLADNGLNNAYSHVLTQVFRQGTGQLLDHATLIRNHQAPQEFTGDSTLKYFNIKSREDVLAYYLAVMQKYDREDCNIITPLNEDVDWFNFNLQAKLGKGQRYLTAHNKRFFVGDRVVNTRNARRVRMADHGDIGDIYNGFIGTVVGVKDNTETSLPCVRVAFKNADTRFETVYYDFYVDADRKEESENANVHAASIDNLELGYALTVHKAQGSTIPVVVYYLSDGVSPRFLTRQLLYTAFTRAKFLIFLTTKPLNNRLFVPYVNEDAYENATSYLGPAIHALVTKATTTTQSD